MAPKQPEKIENPHVASSSEDEQSVSSGEEESGSSDEEDSKKDESAPISTKKPESDSEEAESDSEEGESESDSDSNHPDVKTKPLNTIATKPNPVTVNPPESSTGKRHLNQNDEESNKKLKTGDEAAKKILFQRLFSENDEIAMLQGYLDFNTTRGDPTDNMDAFCDYVNTLINFNATKSQITTKLQRCKKKFKNQLKKGKFRFSKELEQKAFDLSREIWGVDGVIVNKSRSKVKMEIPMAVVVKSGVGVSREIALFFKEENASVFSLDEGLISERWDMVKDGVKKKEMEEKLKMLKAKRVELCLERSGVVGNTTKMIFKDNVSSS